MSTAVGLDKYYNDILTKVYANQDLCKYLYYDVLNPLAQSTIADTTILKKDKTNQRIFVTPFNIETTDKVKSTLHIMVDEFQLDKTNLYFEDMTIDFVICSNVRIWELNDNSGEIKLRVNGIWNELNETFRRSRTVGMGKNVFQYGKIQRFNDYFWGYIMSMSAKDMY